MREGWRRERLTVSGNWREIDATSSHCAAADPASTGALKQRVAFA
jgi:hypothetical protein